MPEGETTESGPNLQLKCQGGKKSTLGMQGSTRMGYPGGYAGFQDLIWQVAADSIQGGDNPASSRRLY